MRLCATRRGCNAIIVILLRPTTGNTANLAPKDRPTLLHRPGTNHRLPNLGVKEVTNDYAQKNNNSRNKADGYIEAPTHTIIMYRTRGRNRDGTPQIE